jgi:hypothetical protein
LPKVFPKGFPKPDWFWEALAIDFICDGKELKCEMHRYGTDSYNEIEIKREYQRLFISFWRAQKNDSGINDIIFAEYRTSFKTSILKERH